jgi:hypothetical protein
MVQLLPIVPPRRGKFERKTTPLPAFYLADTSDGSRGVWGAVNPESLIKIQSPTVGIAPWSSDENSLFHGVYWSESPLPGILAVIPSEACVTAIPQSDAEEVRKYLSKVTVCVVGDEARLDAAIAAGESSVPIVLWNANDISLPWLPCHKVLRNLEDFRAGWMVCLAREHMFFRDVTIEIAGTSCGASFDSSAAARLLTACETEGVIMLAITNEGAWRVHTQPGWADGLLEALHPSLREIAAIQLNHILLARGLDLSPQGASNLEVFHRAEDAVAQLRNGAQVVYLLQPIRSAQLRELIKHGQMLPANSVALDVAALEGWQDAD